MDIEGSPFLAAHTFLQGRKKSPFPKKILEFFASLRLSRRIALVCTIDPAVASSRLAASLREGTLTTEMRNYRTFLAHDATNRL